MTRFDSDIPCASAGRPRLRRFRLAAAAVFAGLALLASPARAGGGLALLNGLAALRGHRAAVDVPYGPLPRQRFDLYRPAAAEDAASGTPLVVFFYGGSWSSGERAQYRFVGEALAARGVAAMVVDYRLYPQARYPEFLEDCARAAGFALEHAGEFGADPRRVFVFGHSAGAYNAAMLALDPRWLRAAGHSPRELAGWIGLAGPYDFLPIGDPVVQQVFDWPATAPDTQPLAHAGDFAPALPAFLGAAADDTKVDPERNTARLDSALREHGASPRHVVYPRIGHALLAGALAWPLTGLAPVLRDTVDFIRETPPAGGELLPDAATPAPPQAAR
jgi:acetyl esterase/lipase